MAGRSSFRTDKLASPNRVCESNGGHHFGDQVKTLAEKLAASDAEPEIKGAPKLSRRFLSQIKAADFAGCP